MPFSDTVPLPLMKILGVSEPDSTFGTSYLSPEEKKSVMATMQKVTKQIMNRTNNMETFDPSDDYVINLAERQMRANADLRGMLFECDKKGEWNGWKVKIDYEAKGGHEMDYRAERWFFFASFIILPMLLNHWTDSWMLPAISRPPPRPKPYSNLFLAWSVQPSTLSAPRSDEVIW